jgi:hypothetical protein
MDEIVAGSRTAATATAAAAAAAAVMGFPTPFPQLKPKLIALEPPVGGYPRSRRLMRLRCALNSENVVNYNL